MQEDRIQKLEILVTEHERTIEELSNQLTEHWATIDRLEKMLHSLAERFLTLEEAVAPEVPGTKPPHY
ncbi:SlyX family protein [Chelativorans composti]|uniref:Protein SlyX homolog n=1 Tax=Chelativorans composti TaxID=768533 RepID=A0ABW5DC98_9HYPH